VTRLRPPLTLQLDDVVAEQVRDGHDQALRELQRAPLAGARVIYDVELADATETPIAHKLGRTPTIVLVSPHRDASAGGAVEEIRSSTYDRARLVVLKASGFSATVKVDVVVA